MLERGIRLARIDTLVKLAGALEVSPNELLEGIAWVPTAPLIGSFEIQAPPAPLGTKAPDAHLPS